MIGKIDAQNQIILNQELVKKLLNFYNLNPVDFKEIKTGVENISVLVKTDKEKFVVRVYRRNNKTLSEITQETECMIFLRNQDVPAPQVLLNAKGESISRTKIDKLFWVVLYGGGYLQIKIKA